MAPQGLDLEELLAVYGCLPDAFEAADQNDWREGLPFPGATTDVSSLFSLLSSLMSLLSLLLFSSVPLLLFSSILFFPVSVLFSPVSSLFSSPLLASLFSLLSSLFTLLYSHSLFSLSILYSPPLSPAGLCWPLDVVTTYFSLLHHLPSALLAGEGVCADMRSGTLLTLPHHPLHLPSHFHPLLLAPTSALLSPKVCTAAS